MTSDQPPGEFVLHRYFLVADRMKHDFFEHLRQHGGQIPDRGLHGMDQMTYMSLWYATLYVVVEGWQRLELHDAEIDQLLESPNVLLLKRYRHDVAHFQRQYMPSRTVAFMGEPTTPQWVQALHSAFGRYFIAWFKANTPVDLTSLVGATGEDVEAAWDEFVGAVDPEGRYFLPPIPLVDRESSGAPEQVDGGSVE